jgi:hypothetical protein
MTIHLPWAGLAPPKENTFLVALLFRIKLNKQDIDAVLLAQQSGMMKKGRSS